MKKVFSIIMFVLFLFPISAFAAENQAADPGSILNKPLEKIGIIIIGGADVKTPDFFNAISESLAQSPNEAPKYIIETSTAAQTKYQNYWTDKDFLDEQPLTKTVVLDFVKYSGYDKVLYIIINQPVMEKTTQGNGAWGYWGTSTKNRASIEVKAYLSDGETILKSVNVAKEDDSTASPLRAKRGAFKKDMKEIALQIKDSL
ncbi:MAG: hypothetical protein WCS30_07875 [Selenomonadaceae bacterium]